MVGCRTILRTKPYCRVIGGWRGRSKQSRTIGGVTTVPTLTLRVERGAAAVKAQNFWYNSVKI
jgi:hypothetical protein